MEVYDLIGTLVSIKPRESAHFFFFFSESMRFLTTQEKKFFSWIEGGKEQQFFTSYEYIYV